MLVQVLGLVQELPLSLEQAAAFLLVVVKLVQWVEFLERLFVALGFVSLLRASVKILAVVVQQAVVLPEQMVRMVFEVLLRKWAAC